MIIGSKVILREKRLDDAWDDYTWETDPELARLDATPLATMAFAQYFSSYANTLQTSFSTSYRFAIDTLGGEHIGNCSYYNVNEARGEAELGIMIGDRSYWDKGYGADTVTTLVNYIFHQTNLKRIYLKTLDSNRRAQKCFKNCDFIPCGHLVRDGFSFTLMEINRKRWQEQQTEGVG
ncbi:hypothetical protein ES703_90918 [subsurface metagenome]